MKCYLVLFFATSFACITTSSREEIVGLRDMALDYVKSQWGEPESQEGSRVVFKNVLTKRQDPETLEVHEITCEAVLNVDGEGIITNWEYQNCRD